MKIRTEWDEPALPTDLTWNPRVYSRVRKPKHRGALVGTLWGVPVDGNACGRAAVYQMKMLTGEVHTVWWDGTMHGDSPYLFDVDTDEQVLRNPQGVAWFCRFEDVPLVAKEYACDFCGKEFSTADEVNEHYNENHPDSEICEGVAW